MQPGQADRFASSTLLLQLLPALTRVCGARALLRLELARRLRQQPAPVTCVEPPEAVAHEATYLPLPCHHHLPPGDHTSEQEAGKQEPEA